jgi:hypothetical protein
LGVHLSSSSPKPGACQQGEAENHVAAGHIDGIRDLVNGYAPAEGRPADVDVQTLYELVMGDL